MQGQENFLTITKIILTKAMRIFDQSLDQENFLLWLGVFLTKAQRIFYKSEDNILPKEYLLRRNLLLKQENFLHGPREYFT